MTTMPETGTLRADDEMFLQRSSNDMRYIRRDDPDRETKRYIPVRVVRVARVYLWVTDGRQEWRIRRDVMHSATQYSGSNVHLFTPAQKAWQVRQGEARQFLMDQGVTVERRSPWIDRVQELADLLRDAQ